jgi:hypothetical protein
MRFGLFAQYLSKFYAYIVSTSIVDTFRFKHLYRRIAAGDLESVPFMGGIFNSLRLFAYIAVLLKRKKYKYKFAKLTLKSRKYRSRKYKLEHNPLAISRYKIAKFLARTTTLAIKQNIRDIYKTEQTYLRWFRRNFRHDIIRDEALIRTFKFSTLKRSAGSFASLSYFRFFKPDWYQIDQRYGGDSTLLPLHYTYEEDRYTSDYEYLSNLMQYNDPHLDIDFDNFRSFHFTEYEYLVEEDDFFDQSMSEDLSGLVSLCALAFFDVLVIDPTIHLRYPVILFLICTFIALLTIDNNTLVEDIVIDNEAGSLTHDKLSYKEYEEFDDVLTTRFTKEGFFMLDDFSANDAPFQNAGVEFDIFGEDFDVFGDFDNGFPWEFHDFSDIFLMQWVQWGIIRRFYYRHLFPWQRPDELDEEDVEDRADAENHENIQAFRFDEGDDHGYYEDDTLSGQIREDDGDELLFDDPFILDAETFYPLETPEPSLWMAIMYLDFTYEGGSFADDQDEAEEDLELEELLTEPDIELNGARFGDEEIDDEDDDEPDDPEDFEEHLYDEDVDDNYDYEYDDELDSDAEDVTEYNPALDIDPYLPLGHLSYQQACVHFYKALFWHFYNLRMPYRKKVSLFLAFLNIK